MTREEAIEIYKGLINPNIIEAFEVLVPELKEIGYDRMLEQIIRGFENWKGNGNLTFNNLRVDDILAWLEKQKEQEHLDSAQYEEGFQTGFRIGLRMKKEQSTDAKLERVIKASRSVLNNWLDGTDCPDVSGDFAELEYAIREYDGEEKQKEQKSEVDESTKRLNENWMKQHFDDYKEQKPAEVFYGPKGDPDPAGVWKPSEEDIKMLEHIIGQYEIGNKNCKTMGYLPRVEELNFLKKILDVWKN